MRQAFIDRGYTRQYVNACVQRVIGLMRWAAEEEHVSGSQIEALKAVRPLQMDRTSAPEGKTVKPVPQDVVDATLPHVNRVVADMIQFQLLTGAPTG